MLVLTGVWIIIQGFIFFQHGIQKEGEALRFIREASNLENHGHFSSPVYFLYFIETLLILISQKIATGYFFVIAVQLALNFFALYVFYKFLYERNGNVAAFLLSLLLIICTPYQLYNSFLYTESIFFSLSLIYSILLLQTERLSTQRIFGIIVFLILLCITRPTGLFFAFATFIYLFVRT